MSIFNKFAPAANYSPLSGFQFFGEVNIDGKNRSLTVTLRDILGQALFEKTLEAC
jgi:alkaline phosphatase D